MVVTEQRKKCFNFLRKLGKRKRGYYIKNKIREEDEDEFLAAQQRQQEQMKKLEEEQRLRDEEDENYESEQYGQPSHQFS